MASTNRFRGLHRGAIDNKSSSLINSISDNMIEMGSVVVLNGTIASSEILPRVRENGDPGNSLAYGIAVGGDTDGIYGDGSGAVDDSTKAANAAGQGVVILTQGRCPARVSGLLSDTGAVIIGDKLAQSNFFGVLRKAGVTDTIIATALNGVAGDDLDIIAVDVQREGVFA